MLESRFYSHCAYSHFQFEVYIGIIPRRIYRLAGVFGIVRRKLSSQLCAQTILMILARALRHISASASQVRLAIEPPAFILLFASLALSRAWSFIRTPGAAWHRYRAASDFSPVLSCVLCNRTAILSLLLRRYAQTYSDAWYWRRRFIARRIINLIKVIWNRSFGIRGAYIARGIYGHLWSFWWIILFFFMFIKSDRSWNAIRTVCNGNWLIANSEANNEVLLTDKIDGTN